MKREQMMCPKQDAQGTRRMPRPPCTPACPSPTADAVMAQESKGPFEGGLGWWILAAVLFKVGHLVLSTMVMARRMSKKSDITIKYELTQRGDPSASKQAVLVTGGCGFLGRHIVELLLERFSDTFTVHVLDAGAKRGFKHAGATYIQGDIRSPAHVRAAVRGKAVVIHCAGLIEAADVDVELLREVNVEGTRHVLEACLEEDVKALVYTSSVAVHYRKRQLDSVPRITETEPTPPEFNMSLDYGKTKKEAERLVQAANGHVLRTCVLRPAGVHGIGDKLVTDPVFNPWAGVAESKATRVPFVWVRDAARAHVAAAVALLHPPPRAAAAAAPPATPAPSPLLARALAPWVAPAADWDAETQTAYGSVRLRDDARFQRTFSGVGGVPEQADDGQAKAAAPLGAVGGKAFHLLYEEYPPYRPFLGTAWPEGSKTNMWGTPAKKTVPAWVIDRLLRLNLYLGQHFGILVLPGPATPAVMAASCTDWLFDITQAKGVLGWRPTPWQTVVQLVVAEHAALQQRKGGAAAAGHQQGPSGKLKAS